MSTIRTKMTIPLHTGSVDSCPSLQTALPYPRSTAPAPSTSCRQHGGASPTPCCPTGRPLSSTTQGRGGGSSLLTSASRLTLLLLLMTSLLPRTSGGLLRRRAFLEDELSRPLLQLQEEEKDERGVVGAVERRSRTDCDTDLHVSKVCFYCGALDRDAFHDVHDGCCRNRGYYRQECEYLYTEDPKRGSSSFLY